MTHINKLVLVPLDEWQRIKGSNVKEGKQVVTVSLPVQKKVNPHPLNQEKVADPQHLASVMKTQKKIQQGLGKDKSLVKQLSKYLPPSRRERGTSLVRYIGKNNVLSWNKDWKLIYKNNIIPDSDIRKLIRHAVLDSDKQLKGMKTFYKGLSEMDIPKIMIANKKGRQLFKKYKTEKHSQFRPPGNLENFL